MPCHCLLQASEDLVICAVVHSSIAAALGLALDNPRSTPAAPQPVRIPPPVPPSSVNTANLRPAQPQSAPGPLPLAPSVAPSSAAAAQPSGSAAAGPAVRPLVPPAAGPAVRPAVAAQPNSSAAAGPPVRPLVPPAAGPAVRPLVSLAVLSTQPAAASVNAHASSSTPQLPAVFSTSTVGATALGRSTLVFPSLQPAPAPPVAQGPRPGQTQAAPTGPHNPTPQPADAQSGLPAASPLQPGSAAIPNALPSAPATGIANLHPASSSTPSVMAHVGQASQQLMPQIQPPTALPPASTQTRAPLLQPHATQVTGTPLHLQTPAVARQAPPGSVPGQTTGPGQPAGPAGQSTAVPLQRAAVGSRVQVDEQAWQLASDVLAAGGTSTTVAAVSTAAQQVGPTSPCCSTQMSGSQCDAYFGAAPPLSCQCISVNFAA